MKYLGTGQSNLTAIGSNALQNSALGLTKQTEATGTSYYARTPEGTLVDERLPSGASYNPVYDAQGDVIGLLDTKGELEQTIRYGPYGENATAEGALKYEPTDDPFLFQGGYHAPGGDNGEGNIHNQLYHFGERYYDPTTGRWTQPDPSTATSMEYVFAGDDPVNEVDRCGELAIPTWLLDILKPATKWLAGVDLACVTVKAVVWIKHHETKYNRREGPSFGELWNWVYSCSALKEAVGWIEEIL